MNIVLLSMNYDIYLRDYLFNVVLESSDYNLNIIMSIIYVVFFMFSVKFPIFMKAKITGIVQKLYSSKLYSYFVTPIIEVMYNVHREYYIVMTSILVVIIYVIITEIYCFRNIEYRYSVTNHFSLELVWSILPALIILHFMMMTIALLYVSDEHPFFGFHVKVIGHQWYWEYETVRCFSSIESIYTNMSEIILPSYRSKYDGFHDDPLYWFNTNEFHDLLSVNNISAYTTCRHILKPKLDYITYDSERLLDTEGVLYVPYRIHVKLLITSMDVIHAFTIPSIGIKADAIPGRLNDLHFFLTDNSAMTHYFGQCSELCGVGHAFMPIHMVSI